MDADRALGGAPKASRHPLPRPGYAATRAISPSEQEVYGSALHERRQAPSAAVSKTRFLPRHSVSGNDPPWHRMVGVEQAETTPPPRRFGQQEN